MRGFLFCQNEKRSGKKIAGGLSLFGLWVENTGVLPVKDSGMVIGNIISQLIISVMLYSNSFRVVVLEDNPFYNQILSTRLKLFLDTVLPAKEHDHCEVKVESYVKPGECLANIRPDTDVVFMDYYLSDDLTALDIIRQIRWRCPEAKIMILSQYYSLNNSLATILEGATGFIQKGLSAIPKSCEVVRESLNAKLQVH
jgi:CheY-like chemotaxis protein